MSFFVVVCYDVSSDRSRLAIAHILMGYGVRVQKSVFECLVDTKGEVSRIKGLLVPLLAEGDNLRIYTLCPKDRGDIRSNGGSPPQDKTDYLVVG